MTYHRWVRHEDVLAYLRLGWAIVPETLAGTHHGCWSVHLAWVCGCKCVEPKR